MTEKLTHSYGCWSSSLTAQRVSLDAGDMNFLRMDSYGVCFVNSVDGEKDKQAVWHLSSTGELNRLTPSDFNVRSRVHEYGGVPYCIHGNTLWFCNLSDQAIYRQDIPLDRQPGSDSPAQPKPFTAVKPELAGMLRYVDFLIDPSFNRLICVRKSVV